MLQIWNYEWNGLIIGQSFRLPERVKKCVWQATADVLKLGYWRGEPLRLDGVFYRKPSEHPFPFLIALEHEYVATNFSEEIVKLFSIRCPLKVGVIYYDKGDIAHKLASTKEEIHRYFDEFSELTREDSTIQYLFIAGFVQKSPLFQIQWHSMTFTVADGPRKADFALLHF